MPDAPPDTFLDAKNDFRFPPDLCLGSLCRQWPGSCEPPCRYQPGATRPAPCQVRESGFLRGAVRVEVFAETLLVLWKKALRDAGKEGPIA